MHKNHKTLTYLQFNELIDLLEENKIKYNFKHITCCATIETASCIYDCSLTGESKKIINVGNIANLFYKKCKIHDLKGQYGYREILNGVDNYKVEWDYKIAYGYQYTDDYFSRKWLKCWSYDINSAFAYAMLCQMPDTTAEPRYNDIIGKHEIGFYKLGGCTIDEGEYADIIFPLMESPFKDYVIEYYNKKSITTDPTERSKWKDFLNIPTGLLARKNIFLRNALIYYSNKYIKSFIDDDTVYCNVDCIVSLKPRNDIPVGNNIGQFKSEHVYEDFKYIKSCEYQWGKECHYSGIPCSTLTDIEDTENWQKNLKYIIRGRKIYENKKN